MIALLSFLLAVLVSPFRSKSSLLAENAMLRHQVVVLRRKVKGRIPLTNCDRWFFVQLYRWFPSILGSLVVIRPETLIRWHRAGYAERLIGAVRRECLDHVIVLGESHLRRVLRAYADYYNEIRTHWTLGKDAPLSRPIQRVGLLPSCAILGGLHHQYVRS